MKKTITASIEESILKEFQDLTDKNHQNRSAILEDLINAWNKQQKT